MTLSFSVVINTLNRADLLEKTLKSFTALKYSGEFEVIVVNGPSTDRSADIVEEWSDRIKAGRCDIANLSKSRNIGISMASGDVVAFIDDDAVPEPEWLEQLAAAYDDPSIAGVGGQVFDHTGYTFQYQFSTADRLANSNWAAGGATEHFCFPGSFNFPYLQGTNASFRRSALLEVGGFDEEIEFYLDETELCCRLIDAGYVIRQLNGAFVHHKFAPSHVRDDFKITRYRFPVIKNKIYFSLKHGRDYVSLAEITEDNLAFSEMHKNDVKFHIEGGRLKTSELDVFADENKRAWDVGTSQGFSETFEYITPEKLERYNTPFKRFVPKQIDDPKSIIITCKDYPPSHLGGVAVFKHNLARSLAQQGHIVHVITKSPDSNRVDLEDGVWVHRMVEDPTPLSDQALDARVPQHIWNWSATALKEAKRIATHRDVDCVISPIWDCEGAAFVFSGLFPHIVSLQTTLSHFLDTNTDLAANEGWMAEFGTPMMALEQTVIDMSDGVWSISKAIQVEVNKRYDDVATNEKTHVIPIGMPDLPSSERRNKASKRRQQVLFVGRLETRKGIDVLFASLPSVLKDFPDVEVRIIGDDTLKIPGKDVTYRESFEDKYAKTDWFDRIKFEGRVDDDTLREAYQRCDIFVAPSRFESFGQIFLEAMRASKPVIGCKAGGMPEIIKHRETGLVIKPDSAIALRRALKELLADPKLAKEMGRAGRADFVERFSLKDMAEKGVDAVVDAKQHFINRTDG